MSYRTDLQYQNGKLAVRDHDKGADTAYDLPKVEATDLLVSDRWGETWKREAGELGNDKSLEFLSDAQAAISRTFSAYKEIREQKSPEVTQAAHLNNVARDFDRALKGLADRSDRAQAQAKARLESIESEFRQSVRWSERDNSELRAVLRGMSDSERREVIGNAIEQGDGQVLAAVIGAHPTLSGMSADSHKATRTRALQKHRPDLYKLEQSISKASEATRRAYTDLLDKADTMTAREVRDKYQQAAIAAAEARQKVEENY
ncbi:hypothetical protein QQM79_01945 [Marinobacteraceae bacterium S3BR75-40.1]